MKYIAGSICLVAGTFAQGPRGDVVLLLGMLFVALGFIEDIVTFMRNQVKKE